VYAEKSTSSPERRKRSADGTLEEAAAAFATAGVKQRMAKAWPRAAENPQLRSVRVPMIIADSPATL